jgi:hypothetical protein
MAARAAPSFPPWGGPSASLAGALCPIDASSRIWPSACGNSGRSALCLGAPSAVVAVKKSIGRQIWPPTRIVTSQVPTAPWSPLIKAIPAIAYAFVRVSDIGTQAEAIPVITRVSPPKTTAVPAPDRYLGGGGHYCCGRQRRHGDGEQSDLTHYRSPLPARARATQSITGQRQKAIAQLANCPRGRRCRRRP